MVGASSIAKIATLGVLNGTRISNLKQFTFGGHVFSPDILKFLAVEIDNGTLDVMYETKKMSGARYNSTENRLYLKYLHAGTIERQALIVHELTHAMFDFQARKMDVATSEAISYIVQCMYIRASMPGERPIYGSLNLDDPDFAALDKVFEEGWRIAGKVLDGQAVDSEDERIMKRAIEYHPEYWIDAKKSAGFDGYFNRN